jgi:hypothetical protein
LIPITLVEVCYLVFGVIVFPSINLWDSMASLTPWAWYLEYRTQVLEFNRVKFEMHRERHARRHWTIEHKGIERCFAVPGMEGLH